MVSRELVDSNSDGIRPARKPRGATRRLPVPALIRAVSQQASAQPDEAQLRLDEHEVRQRLGSCQGRAKRARRASGRCGGGAGRADSVGGQATQMRARPPRGRAATERSEGSGESPKVAERSKSEGEAKVDGAAVAAANGFKGAANRLGFVRRRACAVESGVGGWG